MGHTLSLLESAPYPYGRFRCNVCLEEGCGPVYHCSDCDFDVHVEACAAMATQQTHFSHPHHPLHLARCVTDRRRKCSSCGFGICTWSFRCEPCNYDMHPMCVRAPRFIMHPHHPHPLALSNAANLPGPRRCDGCKMPVANLFYRCHACRYNLHQVCATLPSTIKHVKHQAHMLTLMDRPSQEDFVFFRCGECGEQVKGWSFYCGICHFNLHPGCANLVHELPHFNMGVNLAYERSNATASTSASIECTISYATMASISCNVTHTPLSSIRDLEAVERLLRCAKQEMAKGFASHAAQGTQDDEQDHCPICFEGFDSTNPKKMTSCGHHFHLACILEWMEQKTECPICRKHLSILGT